MVEYSIYDVHTRYSTYDVRCTKYEIMYNIMYAVCDIRYTVYKIQYMTQNPGNLPDSNPGNFQQNFGYRAKTHVSPSS